MRDFQYIDNAYSHGMQRISYIELDGRPAFKMAIHRSGDKYYLYTAHFWHSGLSVVDITDPTNPRFVRFIEGPPNTFTLQVQIAEGKMITSMEKIPEEWGGDTTKPFSEGFLIWDLSDPESPQQLGHYRTGGLGTHRNYYDGGRYVHATALPQGYDGHIYQIVDISDPANPREVSRWWRTGQWLAGGEGGVPFGTFLHGGAYVMGDRAYLPYSAGGFVILDISDVTAPKLVSDLPFSPPFQAFISVHTSRPLSRRPLVVVNSEAIEEMGNEPLGYAGIVDVSDERAPRLVSLFPQPIPPKELGISTFYDRPGRFGPHNQHQWQNQDVLHNDEDLVFLTYFNAGLRVYDISNERKPVEIACFIPADPKERKGPLPKTGLVTQSEDVLVDNRGNIFVSDKNHGVFVLGLDKGA
ncbi:LVIVD repeat-containing protein [Mesorhizobium sp. 1B3]|uniref:LVIVD repeat-containing protein n=1 Tax=Mesorhizobium sp. 1B3 TaxID=3243599 RepID=UPI003D99E48B